MIKVTVCTITKNPEDVIYRLKNQFDSYSCVVLMNKRARNEDSSMVHFGICITDDLSRDSIQYYVGQALGRSAASSQIIVEGDNLWKQCWSLKM